MRFGRNVPTVCVIAVCLCLGLCAQDMAWAQGSVSGGREQSAYAAVDKAINIPKDQSDFGRRVAAKVLAMQAAHEYAVKNGLGHGKQQLAVLICAMNDALGKFAADRFGDATTGIRRLETERGPELRGLRELIREQCGD